MCCNVYHLISKAKWILTEHPVFLLENPHIKLSFFSNTYHIVFITQIKLITGFFSSLLVRHQFLFFMVMLSLFLEFWKYVCAAFQAQTQLSTAMATAHTQSQLEASHFQIRNKADTPDNIKAELISPYEKQCTLAKVHCLRHTASRQVSKLAEQTHICLQNTAQTHLSLERIIEVPWQETGFDTRSYSPVCLSLHTEPDPVGIQPTQNPLVFSWYFLVH